MKKTNLLFGTLAIAVGLLVSCKKNNSTQTTKISTPVYQVGSFITSTTLGTKNSASPTAYKGTLQANTTYSVVGDIIINVGDTILAQSGVTVCVENNSTICVRGVLISLGTQSNPNYFTACGVTPVDQVGTDPLTDPAYNGGAGQWTGICCDTTCTLLDLQWTHVNYTGGIFAVNEPVNGCGSGGTSYGILFQNPKGDLIMTDSWMYGGIDDAVRIQQGRICFMRNTFEKMGYVGGDCLNAKHGTQGVMAYNLFIGEATNGTKCSDKGSGNFVECNINMYNNTYINCGYRQASFSSRGSDIDYEQGGRGLCYNNLIVNCRNGIRIGNGENQIPMPDTTNCYYGYNYIYADSDQEVDQFFPIQAGTWTRDVQVGPYPGAYVVPTVAALGLPANFYSPNRIANGGDDLAYDAPSVAGKNNPMFKNFPLPEPVNGFSLAAISSIATGKATTGSNYDFHLQTGSPAIGIGTTMGITSAFENIPNPVTADVTNPNFAPSVTGPGVDMGCYQTNGSGNQH